MVRIALAGIGYWGPNLLRVFDSLAGVRVKYVCDENPGRLRQFRRQYPRITFISDFRKILRDKDISAVVISTPASTHHRLAKAALLSGKDVFVEKPLTLKASESKELVGLASKRKKVLMVGHLLVYHPAVIKLKKSIDRGDLGRIYYIDCSRLNLGKIRREENVLWSLAVHDIAAVVHLLGKVPEGVEASGSSFIQRRVEDLAFITLYFPGDILAHIHTNWLHPKKVRELTIVGSKKMAVFDDVKRRNKLKVVNQYIEKERYVSYNTLPKLKFGKVSFIDVSSKEPLRAECEHFIQCVKARKAPASDGREGLKVVRVLEAAERAIKSGRRVKVDLSNLKKNI